MPRKRKTQEEYLEKLVSRGIVYKPIEPYSTVTTKILHECLKKHQWKATPNSILNGKGCPLCASNQKKTHEQYEAELLSNSIFYVPIEPYKGALTNILHECLEGHQWKASPVNVLRGSGCPTCYSVKKSFRQTKTHAQYEQELFEKELEYWPVEPYKGSLTKILHECIEGHQWPATPTSILNGRGCPTCATHGFNPDLPSILYYIKLDKFPESFYKIGITNNSISKRFEKDKDKTITVLLEKHFDKGSYAAKEEKGILEKYKALRQKVPGFLKSGGNTELFEEDILGLDT